MPCTPNGRGLEKTFRSYFFLFFAKGLNEDRSPYLNIVSDIKILARHERVCTFVKVDRSKVRISHCLANLARAEERTEFWLGSGPEVVLRELDRELLVIPSS